QAAESGCFAWRQGKGVTVAAFGFVQIILVAIEIAQVDEGTGKVGLKRSGFAKTRFGIVPPSHASLHMAQIVVRRCVVGLENEGAAERGHCIFWSVQSRQRV